MRNNANGNILEKTVENILSQKQVIIKRNVPYTNIYGGKGRTEFVIEAEGKQIRIECKWQQSAGSVDEKFCYLFHNCLVMPENTIIIVVDGNGARESAINWLKKMAKSTKEKEIYVFNITEFLSWSNKTLDIRKEIA